MTESFENLDNILRDWARENVKSLVEPENRYEKQEGGRKKRHFFFETDMENILE